MEKKELKAAELRIGNLVRWEDDSHDIIIIRGLKFDTDDLDYAIQYKETSRDESGCAAIWEFIPIELSPAILESCGFIPKKSKNGQKWFKIKIKSGVSLNLYIATSPHISDDNYFVFAAQSGSLRIRILHLHQLQNLYFALTGTELTFNPSTIKEVNNG